jgi:thiol-disulfide isomerase/thioredoxin
MKKYTLLIGIGIAALAIVGLVLFAPKANDYKPVATKAPVSSPSNDPTTETNTAQTAPGAYIDYAAEVIGATNGTKILFFHAPWCPQCKALETSIKAGPIPANTTIIKVDYDSNQALKQKYGVTTQTTLVLVDDNSNLVKKYVAYSTPSLSALISNLL